MNDQAKIEVICRPAKQADTDDVMTLTSTIWEGDDYVPKAWPHWLSDPQGRLAVAEYQGKVIGLGKLTLLAPGQWWLEGLRTHPDYEGHGVASQLHNYLVATWEDIGAGVLRLATLSTRQKVHHMSERSGFHRLGEFTSFAAPAEDQRTSDFNPVTGKELQQALQFCLDSPSLAFAHGLMDLGWQWASPALPFLENARWVYWWRDRQGVVVLGEEREEEQLPFIQLLACPVEAIEDCLLDLRGLAASLNYPSVAWAAALQSDLAPILEKAGFQRDWDKSLYIFEKKHPRQSIT
jgi:GNAT superfamily N-acetyltransferase